MKLRKEYPILLLIIAILAVYLTTRSKDQTHYELPRPAQTDSQKINRLVITKGNRSVELNKNDEHWYVGPKAYPADAIKVKNMVKAAADLTITDLISESGNYERYDLTDERKINVRAFAGKELVRVFDVGKGAPTNQHTFARLGDDPKVYQARGHLNTTFDNTIDSLRDLAVLSFEKSNITSLTYRKGSESLVLSKKITTPEAKTAPLETEKKEAHAEQKPSEPPSQPQWQDAEGHAVDGAAIERLVNDFSAFKCTRYMEDTAADNLKPKSPVWTLTFNSKEKAYALSVYDKSDAADTEFPALSSTQPYAFEIPKSKVESIERQMDKMLNPGSGEK